MKKIKKLEEYFFDKRALMDDIMRTAKIYGLSKTTAEPIAKQIVEKVALRMQKRNIATVDDLNRFVAAEAEKFNKDLAYDYKNRGKII